MVISSAPLRGDKPRKSNPIIKWLFRLIVTGFVFLALIVIAANAINGTGETQRSSIERIMGEVFQGSAHIKDFKYFSAIPYVGVELENTVVVDEAKSNRMMMNLDYIAFNTGFINILLRRPVFRYLEVRNFYAAPYTLAPKAIIIDHIKPVKGKNLMSIKGQYSKLPFDLTLEATPLITGQDLNYGFKLDKTIKVDGTIGGLQTTLTIASSRSAFKLQDISISKDGKQILNGSFSYSMDGEIVSDLSVADIHAVTNVLYRPWDSERENVIDGDVTIKSLDLTKISEETHEIASVISAIEDIVNAVNAPVDALYRKDEVKADPTILPTMPNTDLRINLTNLKIKDAVLGDVKLPFSAKENTLSLNKIEGHINGGTIAGNIRLSETRGEAPEVTLIQDLQINKWDFGQLLSDLKLNHSDVTGRMNIKTQLTATSSTLSGLKETLGGEASFVISDSEMKSGIADRLMSGLFTALIPNLEKDKRTKINCVMGHFGIENGVANVDTLFADTERLQLVGSGDINIAKNAYGLKLSPEAKKTTLLDITPAIRMSGPLNKPKFSPDTFSLGTKIGGLLLSTVNPVLLAATLTDFGLSAEHSCGQFAPKKEAAPVNKPEEKQD